MRIAWVLLLFTVSVPSLAAEFPTGDFRASPKWRGGIEISRDSSSYHVTIDTAAHNGDVCSFVGKGTVIDGKLVARTEASEGPVCTVKLTAGKRVITLSAEDYKVCQHYCGLQANLSGTFTIPQKRSEASTAHAARPIDPPCDGADYKKHSAELKKIFEADQSDRKDFEKFKETRLIQMLKHDRVRIKRVAEIFAKGCLQSADDYYHAATVFQHGEVPDHFFQTYIWAYKAFKVGKESAGIMAANGVDRYLMNLGFKQLYGGQATSDPKDKNCFCLWPIEESFPEEKRKELKFKSKKDLVEWIQELNKGKEGCSNLYCAVEAKPAGKGLVPGVW